MTGANTGVGLELAAILYSRNARVFIAARNEKKALTAISSIRSRTPKSTGTLDFLSLDLADLSTIKTSANEFLSKSDRLDVLFNNAGVMLPDSKATTAQGYDLQLGVNNIGTFMFTKLLTPMLRRTAAESTTDQGSVRVVWVGSSAAEGMSPQNGIPLAALADQKSYIKQGNMKRYAISKAGNYLHSGEFARRYADTGIVSVALNPGNLDSELWRTQGSFASWFLRKFVLHAPVNGAYTELFAGLSPEVKGRNGDWVVPFGRFMPVTRGMFGSIGMGTSLFCVLTDTCRSGLGEGDEDERRWRKWSRSRVLGVD